jgi:hypothetical protein
MFLPKILALQKSSEYLLFPILTRKYHPSKKRSCDADLRLFRSLKKGAIWFLLKNFCTISSLFLWFCFYWLVGASSSLTQKLDWHFYENSCFLVTCFFQESVRILSALLLLFKGILIAYFFGVFLGSFWSNP